MYEIIPLLNKKVHIPANTPISLYIEVQPNFLMPICGCKHECLDIVMVQLIHADIIVFEKKCRNRLKYKLPTCQDYLNLTTFAIEPVFSDGSNDQGFMMRMLKNVTFEEMAHYVAIELETEPYLLRFFKEKFDKDETGPPLKMAFDKYLVSIMQTNHIFYDQLIKPVERMTNRVRWDCQWVQPGYKKVKKITLYPDKEFVVCSFQASTQFL